MHLCFNIILDRNMSVPINRAIQACCGTTGAAPRLQPLLLALIPVAPLTPALALCREQGAPSWSCR